MNDSGITIWTTGLFDFVWACKNSLAKGKSIVFMSAEIWRCVSAMQDKSLVTTLKINEEVHDIVVVAMHEPWLSVSQRCQDAKPDTKTPTDERTRTTSK